MHQLSLSPAFLQAEISTWRNKGFLLKLLRQVTILDSDAERHCFAYNRTLARKLKVSPDTITRGLERLARLGAIAIEHVQGIERRIAARLGVGELRDLLFPKGRPTPAQRARIRAARCSAAGSTDRFFSDDVAEGIAATVAEGPIESSPSGNILYGTSCRRTDSMRRAVKTPAIVADPAVVSALCACLPESDAVSIAREAAKAGWSLERVLGAIRTMGSTQGIRIAGAWLRMALREGNWLPPAPSTDSPSDLGMRPARKPVTAPAPIVPVKIDYVTAPPSAGTAAPIAHSPAPVALKNVPADKAAKWFRRAGGKS
jgi:DNA-binding Lrp family transcriptional regulator